MYSVTIKTDTGAEPVTSATVRNYLKYSDTDTTEIALIDSLTKAAREAIEHLLNVSLKQKTYEVSFDSGSLDDYHLRLPYGPYKDNAVLTYYSDSGEDTVLTINTDFYLKGKYFKELYLPSPNSEGYYVLEFESGYGIGTESLPDVLEAAIMELTKYWYDRDDQTMGIPASLAAKIYPYSKNYMI